MSESIFEDWDTWDKPDPSFRPTKRHNAERVQAGLEPHYPEVEQPSRNPVVRAVLKAIRLVRPPEAE